MEEKERPSKRQKIDHLVPLTTVEKLQLSRLPNDILTSLGGWLDMSELQLVWKTSKWFRDLLLKNLERIVVEPRDQEFLEPREFFYKSQRFVLAKLSHLARDSCRQIYMRNVQIWPNPQEIKAWREMSNLQRLEMDDVTLPVRFGSRPNRQRWEEHKIEFLFLLFPCRSTTFTSLIWDGRVYHLPNHERLDEQPDIEESKLLVQALQKQNAQHPLLHLVLPQSLDLPAHVVKAWCFPKLQRLQLTCAWTTNNFELLRTVLDNCLDLSMLQLLHEQAVQDRLNVQLSFASASLINVLRTVQFDRFVLLDLQTISDSGLRDRFRIVRDARTDPWKCGLTIQNNQYSIQEQQELIATVSSKFSKLHWKLNGSLDQALQALASFSVQHIQLDPIEVDDEPVLPNLENLKKGWKTFEYGNSHFKLERDVSMMMAGYHFKTMDALLPWIQTYVPRVSTIIVDRSTVKYVDLDPQFLAQGLVQIVQAGQDSLKNVELKWWGDSPHDLERDDRPLSLFASLAELKQLETLDLSMYVLTDLHESKTLELFQKHSRLKKLKMFVKTISLQQVFGFDSNQLREFDLFIVSPPPVELLNASNWMGQFLKEHPNLELFHVQFSYQQDPKIDAKQQVMFGLKHDKLRSLRFPVMKFSMTRDELEHLLWSFPNIESLCVLTQFKYPAIWYSDKLMAYFKPRWPKSLKAIHIGSYAGLGPLHPGVYSPFRGESALNFLQITGDSATALPPDPLRPVSKTSGSTRDGDQQQQFSNQPEWVPGQTIPANHLRGIAQAQLFDHLSTS